MRCRWAQPQRGPRGAPASPAGRSQYGSGGALLSQAVRWRTCKEAFFCGAASGPVGLSAWLKHHVRRLLLGSYCASWHPALPPCRDSAALLKQAAGQGWLPLTSHAALPLPCRPPTPAPRPPSPPPQATAELGRATAGGLGETAGLMAEGARQAAADAAAYARDTAASAGERLAARWWGRYVFALPARRGWLHPALGVSRLARPLTCPACLAPPLCLQWRPPRPQRRALRIL